MVLLKTLLIIYSKNAKQNIVIKSVQMFNKIGVLKIFAKFTSKHLRWSLFFNKFAGFQPATLFKKTPQHRCFPLNFAKFLNFKISTHNTHDFFWLTPKFMGPRTHAIFFWLTPTFFGPTPPTLFSRLEKIID